MALHEHADIERDFEALAELFHPLRFALAAAIGEQDEGYALLLEVRKCFVGARKGVGAAKEDAVDTEEALDV